MDYEGNATDGKQHRVALCAVGAALCSTCLVPAGMRQALRVSL